MARTKDPFIKPTIVDISRHDRVEAESAGECER